MFDFLKKTIPANSPPTASGQAPESAPKTGDSSLKDLLSPAGIKINRAVLVAGTVELGTKPEYFQYKEDLTKLPFNWTKIKTSKFFPIMLLVGN